MYFGFSASFIIHRRLANIVCFSKKMLLPKYIERNTSFSEGGPWKAYYGRLLSYRGNDSRPKSDG